MKQKAKTKGQLTSELAGLRQRVAELEKVEAECKRAEEAVRESEERYRAIFESANDGIVTLDNTGCMIAVNKKMEQMTGYRKEDFLGKNVAELDVLTPKSVELILENFSKRMRGISVPPYEIEIIASDGTRLFAELNATPLREKDKVIGDMAIIRDITERKRAEAALKEYSGRLEKMVEARTEELKEAQERFRGLYDSSKDAIVFASPDGTLVDVNNAFSQLTGYSRGELLSGKKYQDITPEEYREWAAKIIEGILRTGESEEYEKEYIRKDGSRVSILLTVFDVKGYDGKSIGPAAIIEDITERKEMQQRLLRSERLAVLGQLAGGVGHELRNPLGAIKSAAYFLNMALEEPEPEVKETLEILEKEVATSERIISSLLDFARPKPPIRRKVDVNDVVQEALSCATVPENVGVVSQPAGALPVILADPDQLRQVFANIILNAIQAMPQGGRLVVKSEAPSPGWVAVSFADTGAGIPEQDLGRLFEPLFSTKAKGIGLGLAVTKTLVEGHGGTIRVQTEMGKGSTFTVRLPISRQEEKQHGGESQHPDSG
jgi:PAS domain S-box-containing protein